MKFENVKRGRTFRFETSFLIGNESRKRYWVPLKALFTISFEAFWDNKFNPLADAPMCGRWSLNKNFGREIAMDENTRTSKTNGPFNREEKRHAQPQTLLNLWSASNVTFENILLRSFPFRNFRKWIVVNRDESFIVVLQPRRNISIDFNFIRWYINTVIINRYKYQDTSMKIIFFD